MTTRSIICLLGFIICLNADYFGEDIVLKSGTTYKNIDVFKHEADRLLITHPGGMATIYLKDCPKDIQRKYNYNTNAADAAISEREKKVQATQEQLQRDQKIQLENWKKQQAAKEQQKAIDDYKKKDTAAKIETERLMNMERNTQQDEIYQKSVTDDQTAERRVQEAQQKVRRLEQETQNREYQAQDSERSARGKLQQAEQRAEEAEQRAIRLEQEAKNKERQAQDAAWLAKQAERNSRSTLW